MKDDEISENLLNLLNKIAVEQKFETFEIKVIPTSSGGANYTSKLYHVRITGNDRNELRLFAKVAVISEELREQMLLQIYDTERMVYTKLMKAYKDLEEKHGVNEEQRLGFPKFYGADATHLQEIIVLEDVTSRGFESANRFQSVDWQYAAAAITELAKFHALSIAYQHEYPSEFDKFVTKLSRGFISPDEEFSKAMFNSAIQSALAAVRKENKEKLKTFLETHNHFENYNDLFLPSRREVIIHVDFRPSNIMHKLKDDNTIEVIPMDYQTVQGGCPVIDLLYFIFTATDGQFRAQHYQELIDHYHLELGAALARLGLDVEDKYSKKYFELEMKEKLPFGLLSSILLLPLIAVPEDQTPDLDNYLISAEVDEFAPDLGTQYTIRLNEIVDNYNEWGILV